MLNKKFSRFPIVNVGIVCLVSILGTNALSLTFASPAAACGGWLNACPPKRPEIPPTVDLNLPNFDGRNIASCVFYRDSVVDTSTGGQGQILDCSRTSRNRISNSYCYKKGFSSAKYCKVYDGNSSTRRKSWLLYLNGGSSNIMVSKGTWRSQPADNYFSRIDCNN